MGRNNSVLYQLHTSYMHYDYEGEEKSTNIFVAIINPSTQRRSLWNALMPYMAQTPYICSTVLLSRKID